jgi:proteasome activator subunit 4
MDDAIIKQLADMTMSKYVSVRKIAQRALDSLTHLYDGTRSMLLDKFFDALQRES